MNRPDFSAHFGVNAAYAEKVYGEWLKSPESVPAEWRTWFERAAAGGDGTAAQREAEAIGTERPIEPPRRRAAAPAPARPPARRDGDGAGDTDGEVLEPLRGVAARIV